MLVLRCPTHPTYTGQRKGRFNCEDCANVYTLAHNVSVQTLQTTADRIADHIDGYDRDDLGESPDR